MSSMRTRSSRLVELAKLTYAHDYFNTQNHDEYDSDAYFEESSDSEDDYEPSEKDSSSESENAEDIDCEASNYVNVNTAKRNFKYMEGECETNLKGAYAEKIFNTNFDSLLLKPVNTIPSGNDQEEENKQVEEHNPVVESDQVEESNQVDENDGMRNSSVKKRAAIYESKFLTENRYKKTSCPYCDELVHTQHFARHLDRNHDNQKEVIAAAALKVNGKDDPDKAEKNQKRKILLTLIRNMGNMKASGKNILEKNVIPRRRTQQEATEHTHVLCPRCKGYYLKTFIARHDKICPAGNPAEGRSNALNASMVYMACQKEYGKLLSKLALKEEVLVRMRGDEISQEIMNDILIFSWGDDLLKKTPSQRSKYHITAKMRRCANFVVNMRKINSTKYKDMLSCLDPFAFEDTIEAVKIMSGYNAVDRSFEAGSTALQFGAYLKQICCMTKKLIYRKCFKENISNIDEVLKKLDCYKDLVESQWTTELASLANKQLESKAADKPKLLPLTNDIQKLRNYVDEIASKAYDELMTKETQQSYKILTETTLIATILHNRKRVGDVQYLLLEAYRKQREQNKVNNCDEFMNALSQSEKVLVSNYERVVTIGKGSRQVPVLIPKEPMLKYFDKIYSTRKKRPEWFLETNRYFFAQPKSARWIDGCSIIRRYAKKCGAENPQLLSSVRLRKHVATITQILAMKTNEVSQLAKFMGHTMKTHDEFYKLPNDVYQMAKVSKILLLAENGNISQFENKSLDEIEIDLEEAVLEDEDISETGLDNSENELMEQPTTTRRPPPKKGLDIVKKNPTRTRRARKQTVDIDLGIISEDRNEEEEDKEKDEEDKENDEEDKNEEGINQHKRPQPHPDVNKNPKRTRRARKQTVDIDLGIIGEDRNEDEEDKENDKEDKENDKEDKNEEENTLIPPRKKSSPMTRKGQRKTWDLEQKKVALAFFKKTINRKEFPKKILIDEFIKKNEKYGFTSADVKRIRTLITNETRMQNTK